MHYKAPAGTATYAALQAFFERLSAAHAAHDEWAQARSIEHQYSYNWEILDRPVGVTFKPGVEPAPGWKFNKKNNFYMVDSRTAAGRKLVAEIKALPQIGSGELGECLSYARQNWPLKNGGFGYTISRAPGVEKGKTEDCYVIAYDDRYTGPIPDDLVEILTSEAKALTA